MSWLLSVIVSSIIGSYIGFKYELYKEKKERSHKELSSVLVSIASLGSCLNELYSYKEITLNRALASKEIIAGVESNKKYEDLPFKKIIRGLSFRNIIIIDFNTKIDFLFLYNPNLCVLLNQWTSYINDIENIVYNLNQNIDLLIKDKNNLVLHHIAYDHITLDNIVSDSIYFSNLLIEVLTNYIKEKYSKDKYDYFLTTGISVKENSYLIESVPGFEKEKFLIKLNTKDYLKNF